MANGDVCKTPKLSLMRIIEAVIIAGIVGGVGLYGGSIAIRAEFRGLCDTVGDIKSKLSSIESAVNNSTVLNAVQSEQIANLAAQVNKLDAAQAKQLKSISKGVEEISEKVDKTKRR